MIETECGILYYNTLNNNPISLNTTINIFKNLNHRGRDCYGIITKDITLDNHQQNNQYLTYRKEGLISTENFSDQELNKYSNEYICHNRYATSGGDTDLLKYCQPIYSENDLGWYYLVFNGNIPQNIWDKYYINDEFIKEKNDTMKLIMYINNIAITKNANTWEKIIKIILEEIHCAYSISIITEKAVYFFKDNLNFKPLCYSYY